MAFVLPRAKKAVCERRSVVRVVAVGERVRRAVMELERRWLRGRGRRTEAGELQAEEQIEWDVVGFCLRDKE
jgi:hypothetical protein